MFYSEENHKIDIDVINTELTKVHTWCKSNKLTINIDKTNYIIFKTTHRKFNVEGALAVGDLAIQNVPFAVYLGVTLDPSLAWKSHIDTIIKKVSQKVGLISYLRHYLPKSALLLFYNCFILPHIMYCIEIWGNTYKTHLDRIFKFQKRIIRLITFSSPNTPSAPLFRQLGILNIYKLCKLQTCVFAFDLKAGHYAHSIDRYATSISHSYDTRLATGDNFVIPKVNLSTTQNNIYYSIAKHWNETPNLIKSIKSRNLF